jgi:hypothetical protein
VSKTIDAAIMSLFVPDVGKSDKPHQADANLCYRGIKALIHKPPKGISQPQKKVEIYEVTIDFA